MKWNKKRYGFFALGTILLLLLILLLTHHKKRQEFTFSTATVERGSISNVITATGTIQALKTVEVGTQVSGVINKIYVDFNSHVKKGQLLAEIDKTPLIASLQDAQASLDDAGAELAYNEANYQRIKSLYEKSLVAQSDYDLALYNYSKAMAGMKIARAKYDKAKVNLEYASIFSPIDGVVLNRAVNEGQTVAASFNTPTLFSIVNDLTQMQVEADIDEADIGQVKEGQRVEFTVDAFPDKNFTGEVTQVRLQPTVVSNVTTYTVIVKASNPEKILMPGMTANITIIAQESSNARLIPARALRFKPDSMTLKEYFKPPQQGEQPGFRTEQWSGSGHMQDNESFYHAEKVWIKKGGYIFPRRITVGINDGTNAEVLSGLSDDDVVIVSINYSAKKGSTNENNARSPFMPRPPSGRRK